MLGRSAAPQDLTLPDFQGHATGPADLPSIDIEDDSSFAWAVFRQTLDDGHSHVFARRLVGSAFEAPAQVDGMAIPAAGDASQLAIELNGRGEGIAATNAGGAGVFGAILHRDQFFGGTSLGAGTPGASYPAVGIGENNDAFAAWLPGDGTAHIRQYDIDPAKATPPGPLQDIGLSDPQFGAVDGSRGMDMGVNRAGDAVVVFVQGEPGSQRLVSGTFDRAPGSFRTYTTSKFRSFARPPLSWAPSFDLWGTPTYRVEIDGQPVAQTQDTKVTLVNPVADGQHTWRVVATDRRGQTATTPARPLRVDATPPALTFKVTGTRKRGKPVKVAVTAADGSLTAPAGSGIATIKVDYGDGYVATARKATHRYAKGKTYTIRVSATDKAGNALAVTRRVTIKK
jgi:hypothetical protein